MVALPNFNFKISFISKALRDLRAFFLCFTLVLVSCVGKNKKSSSQLEKDNSSDLTTKRAKTEVTPSLPSGLTRAHCEFKKIGEIKDKFLSEASGMAHSALKINTFYHLSDNSNVLLVTDQQGQSPKKIKLSMPKLVNPEDLTQGPCFQGKSCIFISDTGNNNFNRDQGSLFILEEYLDKKVTPHGVNLNYLGFLPIKLPLPPPDIEAMAYHPPSGDIFFFTKEYERGNPAKVAIFKITSEILVKALETKTPASFIELSRLDLRDVIKLDKKEDYQVTSAEFSPDGKILILLLRKGAIAMGLNEQMNLIFDKGWSSSHIAWAESLNWLNLDQQEAITFTDQNTLVYSTENKTGLKKTPLMQATCRWSP